MGTGVLNRRAGVVAVLLCLLAGCTALFFAARDGSEAGAAARADAQKRAAVPHIKHYFILVLENENYSSTFGPTSKAPYLAKRLRAKGAFIPNFYATGHFSLDNYISMVSGQGPNPQTQADCPFFTEFTPATPAANGQYLGSGCVYPAKVKTVADQLAAHGLRWKGYMEDIGAGAPGEAKTCRHPDIGTQDHTQSAEVGDQYAGRHNPFIYFHSIIDSPSCARYDVGLTRLPRDLRKRSTTPHYSFITPNLCNDGHDEPCVDGKPGGLVSANRFLLKWVPRILKSPGFKDHGMLLITFDEAEAGDDASGCCGEVQGPNTPNNGALIQGVGGGKIGAVALSPCIRPGTVTKHAYNHYSQLRWVEQNFGLKYLGYAGVDGLRPFGRDILNRPRCGRRR